MQFTGSLRRTLLCLVAVAAAGCASDNPTHPGGPPPPAPNFVRLQSDARDYIGGGRSYEYTQANAVIDVTAREGLFTEGPLLSIDINGDESWFASFQAPVGTSRLVPGTYTGLTRYPFHDPAAGGLSWSGEGRGCNTLTGSFTVDSVTYAADTLKTIDLRFVQHCEGGEPALRGTIHWRADDTTPPPGPINPVPAGLWQPPPGATPATGDYVYLLSDAGDYIGGGETYSYAEAGATITVAAEGRRVSVSVDGWHGDFVAMNTISRIEPGYYAGLSRYPFHNPAKGGLDWGGNGRGCNTLTGWFAVDRVTYVGDTLTALELRFEQHCEGGTPALRGKIRWSA